MSKSADRRQELGEALIRAAEKTIRQKGLHALKARELAKDVGCALGAIYNVFPDLDALILEVNARTLAKFKHKLDAADLAVEEIAIGAMHPAVVQLVRLASAYLDIVLANKQRWRALFDHRMGATRQLPQWYRDAQKPLFLLVEEPIRALRPKLNDDERMVLARSFFAAVHGVVSLGLDEKLMPMSTAVLRAQTEEIVAALGNGLLAAGKGGARGRRKT